LTDGALGPELIASLVLSRGRKGARAALEGRDAGRVLRLLDEERRQAEQIARACSRNGLMLLAPQDPRFPPLLRHIPDPPLVVFARGNLERLHLPTLAVVGARRCTHVGRAVAASIAQGIAASGWVVVSGLARGIDAAAHRAALPHGLTLAVLGNGLAKPYPPAHRPLADDIVARGGVLLSEYGPFVAPRAYHFPERNRLISGLSRGVVVVEAGERSGSLITARMALEQGREVMAVPGAVSNPVSRGCHRLIRDGAALVESFTDVFQALGIEQPPDGAAGHPGSQTPADAALDPRLVALLDALDQTLTTLDQILSTVGQPAHQVVAGLVELELSGFVQQVPGGYIRRPFQASSS